MTPRARSAALWTGLLVLCAISSYYFFGGGLANSHYWTGAGLRRLTRFTLQYVPAALLLVRFRASWFLPLVAGLTALYTAIVAGPVAPAIAALFFLACYCLGDRMLGRDSENSIWLPTVLGAALYLALISVTAGLQVHYVPVYLVLLVAPVVWNWRNAVGRIRSAVRLSGRSTSWTLPVLVYVLLLHWLVALKPEVSADGLSMHLAIPAEMAYRHFWEFDFHQKIWAVMPMGADWLYTLVYLPGGEMAARLLNFGMLGMVAGLLFELSGSRLAVALFVSVPLVQLETGSMFVENTWAAILVGAFAALVRYRDTKRSQFAVACAMLAGAAISVKFGGLALVIPLAILLGWELRIHRANRMAWLVPLCFLIFAAPPYINAWVRTGNPLFPFLNRVFLSPYFDQTINVIEQRYRDPLTWDSLFQVVFRTHRFLEGYDGSAGFQFAILAPLSLLAFGRRTPWRVWTAALIAIVFAGATFSALSYVRYLYPAMALMTIPIGWLLTSTNGWLRSALTSLGFGLLALNVWFLPASGHWHRDFFLPPRRAARDAYVTALAPGRKMVDYLNAQHPGETVAFLVHNQIAGLRAPVHQNSWHDWEFWQRLQGAGTAEDVARIADGDHIRFFIVPVKGGRDTIEPEPVRQFVDRFTELEYTAGALSVARWKP